MSSAPTCMHMYHLLITLPALLCMPLYVCMYNHQPPLQSWLSSDIHVYFVLSLNQLFIYMIDQQPSLMIKDESMVTRTCVQHTEYNAQQRVGIYQQSFLPNKSEHGQSRNDLSIKNVCAAHRMSLYLSAVLTKQIGTWSVMQWFINQEHVCSTQNEFVFISSPSRQTNQNMVSHAMIYLEIAW